MARLVAFLLAALLVVGLLAEAADAATTRTSCVKNNIDLILAINNAKGDAEGSIENIRLVQDNYKPVPGSYSIAGFNLVTEGYPDDKTFNISGGWGLDVAGNCASQLLNPQNTTLDLGGANFTVVGNNRQVKFEGLTVAHFGDFRIARDNCVNPDGSNNIGCPESEQVIDVSHSILMNGSAIGIGSFRDNSIVFSNNIVSDVRHIRVTCHLESCEVAHNTISTFKCPASGEIVELERENGSAIFHHNIVSSTCAVDVDAVGQWAFSKNLYESSSGTAPDALIKTSDPGFIDPAAGDFHLRETGTPSPAINAGMTEFEAIQQSLYFPSQDLDGPAGKRVIGGRIDLGAYESSVDTAPVQWVTTNVDSGLGTLRQALINANAAKPNPVTIKFDFFEDNGFIPPPSVCGPDSTILLKTPLPPITNSVSIDGYSADLATYNTAEVGFNAGICVWLKNDPNNSVPVTQGLVVPAGTATEDVALVLKGLRLSGFSASAIALDGGSHHLIQGNVFGGGASTTNNNGRGILVGSGVHWALIGGDEKSQRNWIGQSTDAGTLIRGYENFFTGNLVGPGANGLFDGLSRNQFGVKVEGNGNWVDSNTISGNLSDAVWVLGSDNLVNLNVIGFSDGCGDGSCGPLLGNRRGVFLLGSGNQVRYNRIGGSGKQGVAITDGAQGNELHRNRYEANTGLAIDLGADEVADDPQVADATEATNAANRGQNFPVLQSASGNGLSGAVSGTLMSRNGDYTIELFASDACDASGHGEGEVFIGSGTVTVYPSMQPDGNGTFSIPVTSGENLLGKWITATATSKATHDTSEMSACEQFTSTNAAPVVPPQTRTLPAGSPKGTTLPKLLATDDNLPQPPQLTFGISNGSSAFSISPDGTLKQEVDDPFATGNPQVLTVQVGDGALVSAPAQITIVPGPALPAPIFHDGFEDPVPMP